MLYISSSSIWGLQIYHKRACDIVGQKPPGHTVYHVVKYHLS